MAVSKRLRFEVFTRDNHACRYCGTHAPDAVLTIDHVIPTALGGSDDPSNLVTACKDCNAGKSSVHPGSPTVAAVSERALRWKTVFDECMATWRMEKQGYEIVQNEFIGAWNTWSYNNGDRIPIEGDWRTTIDRFFNLGFEPEDLIRLIPEAMKTGVKEPWRYYCKVVWNNLQDIQSRAESAMAREGMPDDPALYEGHEPIRPVVLTMAGA